MPPPILPALIATLSTQAFVVVACLAAPVMTREVAGSLDVDSTLIGYYVSITYLGAMTSTLFAGGLILRFGALRICQASLMLAAAGALLLGVDHIAAFAASGVLVGLAYGPTNAASSHLLVRAAPEHLLGRVLSAKQTSVPAGGVLAGLLVPVAVLAWGWQTAGPAVALLCLAAAALVDPWRAVLDADRNPSAKAFSTGPASSLALLRRNRALGRAAVASIPFSMGQFCFTAFFVAFVVERTAFGLAAAGSLFSIAFATGIAARLAWGWVADLTTARAALAMLGLAMAAASFAATQLSDAWGYPAVAALGIAFGATAASWNGVYLAEVARSVPPEEAGAATGAAMFPTMFGAVLGPALFGGVAAAWGYGPAFLLIGVVTGIAGLLVLRAPKG